MEHSTDYIWRAYEDRTLTELIQVNPEPDTEPASEYVDEFEDWQEFQAAIPDPDEPSHIPTPLTFHPTHPISATVIEHVPLLPEYPETHEEGFAYIVNIDKSRPDKLRAVMKSTQLYNATKRKFLRGVACVVHPQGQGKIQSHGACNVMFQTFIPLLPERYPYAIFYSRGTHSHPPPPPTKAPWIIASEVLDLICKNLDPNLKLSTFLRSPALREFCQQHKCKTLSQIHSSFAKIDKVAALLWKQRALSYPYGKGIAGLRHQLDVKPDLKEFVQEIYETSEGTFVFCAFAKQLQFLATRDAIEVDMSYKRVKGDINEVIFATMLTDHGKILEHDPNLKYWVRHKRHPVIAAGLCKACSGVSPEFFSRFRPHTNAVEQSHNKSYALGTYDSLLGAVTKSLYLDQQDLDQLENRDTFGIHHRYQADDIEARFGRNLQREARKREKAEQKAAYYRDARIQFDIDDQILLEASSSGFVFDIERRSRSATPRPRSRSATPRRSSSRGVTRSQSRASTSSSLRRTAAINSQNRDHLSDLRELEIQQKRQEIEDAREERQIKRQQLELETKEQELRVAKMELERQLVAAQLEQIKRGN
ncbi:uncharacterized protein N7498_008443 [Penicillium cinerascens]|uniref:Uncharacterized protein n=1 Tax=Penicillium cinerascens TaxID=70096 RepID=A0A9W9JDQ0_9EURO|nr:uncharacterized protein N7498_008443 [Penicillium cinerascens]KAJ5195005.1 hypothetical protein N7498_008443 [Penicillium cinerascens]